MYYCISCLDIFVLLGLIIWAMIAVDNSAVEQCWTLPEETGCKEFLKATRTHIIIGWIYIVTHCCACPIGLICYSSGIWRPGRTSHTAARYEEDWESDGEGPIE